MQIAQISARKHLSLIRRCGLAVDYFPRYYNFKLDPHGLDVVLLTLVVDGRGRHVMDDQVFEESGSSLAVTHYGQKHDILTDDQGMEIYNIYVDLQRHPLPELPAEFRDVLAEVLPLHPQFQNLLNRRVRLALDQPDSVVQLAARMYREQQANQPGVEEVVRSCFRILLIECCRQAVKSGLQMLGASAPGLWLERVRRHLDQNFRQEQSLEKLAELAGVSPSYLSRSFARYTGKRLFDYLCERRIQAAMLSLRSGDQKVLAIALSCGFHDLAYFNRRFRQMVGQTPREYRRQVRGE